MRIAFISKDLNRVEFIEEREQFPETMSDDMCAIELANDEVCNLEWGYQPNETPRFFDLPAQLQAKRMQAFNSTQP